MTLIQKELKNAYIGEYKWKPWENTLAYYPLEIDTKDYSWNSRDGTNSNVTFSNGIATFNGINSQVTISDASWQRPTSNFTILAWFRCAGANNYNDSQEIVWKHQNRAASYSNFFYAISVWADKKAVWWFANGSSWSFYPWTSNYSIEYNTWYLWVITNDWTTKTLYINWEQQVQSTGISTTTSTSSIPLIIWAAEYSWGSAHHINFNWNISKVILENKTWTAQEISDYYNQTKSNYWL